MILRFLPHSPYARKVVVAAHELGMIDAIEVVEAHVFDPETPLLAENPMGKVPALIRDDGSVLYDSTVICEWLDAQDGQNRLFPAAGEARIQALRRNALGDGLGQAATWNIRERYRPDGERSDGYMAYYERTIDRCLAALEAEDIETAGRRFDIGDVATACAISYLDFRYPDRAWRERFPKLGAWVAQTSKRPSMEATGLAAYDGQLSP
ncbi:MAG TPA: glutathione S-transferase [Alphaproteobacteria bacterium]|nr:glutathione S-transferase [Alphaproteobacteria bacterium]